ncbi:MAG TPA: hypothetical protein PLD84_13290, partial [Chitinophagales bacterium]|nr:hypothetical protein [Chitinophagales bacterium]
MKNNLLLLVLFLVTGTIKFSFAQNTFISLNLGNSRRDEQNEDYRFGKRLSMVKDKLKELYD